MKIEKIFEEEKQEAVKEQRAKQETTVLAGNVPVSAYDNKMNVEETESDYTSQAIQAANDLDAVLTQAWTDSHNNTTESNEYGAVVIKRGDKYVSSEVKKYKEGSASPKVKKKDLQEGDVVSGDFHTHPYETDDIAKVTGAYNWDGTGTGPSGADFCAPAYAREKSGYFMIIESGTTRSIIIIQDSEKYRKAFVHDNGQTVTDEAGSIDAAIDAAVLNKDYMQKNPNAANPKPYQEVYWIGLVNGLNEVKKKAGGDIGLKLLRSKKDKKSEYDTVFP